VISFRVEEGMPADRQFTIGRLAEKVEIPASTVRYYERIGLLEPEDRSQGNYRLYGQASLRRLRFIRAAQSIGFTLDDIRLLMGAQNRRTPSCRDVQHLIAVRLTEIDKQMANLRQVQTVLKASAAKCRKTQRPRCCHVIESLEAISEIER
jgi:MerR family mercuric resistance operon transcriptional regulator